MLIPLDIIISLTLSFLIVYLIIPKIIKVSNIKKLFDVPNHRSAAKHVVPTLGGIAILAGFTVSSIVASNRININELKQMFAVVFIMFLIGLKDDLIGLAARKKFLIQIGMALYLVIMGSYRFTDLHGIFGFNEIGTIAGSILSVVAIVGIINAINLIDGIDGLASGVSILISIVYGFWFLNAGDFMYAITCFSLTGSLIAFFMYNVFGKTNKIFMGDTGSLILGTIIAVLTIRFNEFIPENGNIQQGLPAISLAILIVPIIDTIRVFSIRIMKGKSPFTPDMNHIHHDVLKLTGNHLTSSLIIISVNALLVLLAFCLIDIIGNGNLFILLLVTGFIIANIPLWILRFQNRKSVNSHPTKSIYAFSIFTKKGKS
jgi:UDP-GlcNAc:undecaprenyl-phosphate/decaprenyl-phosphate GlcNAc-1-phosphate transferase